MSKHTEGPWAVEVEGLRGGRYYSVIRPGDTEPIDIHEEDNGEADARLIAAAPTMLATLKEAEAMFRWYGDLHAAKPDHDKAKRNYGMADKCAAAIAEAEGGDDD